jgi:putative effector of murein hydrolase
MDDGIIAIILIISVLSISLFFFAYFFEGLIVVFLLISIVLIPLLIYTCLFVIATKWDRYRRMKEWDFLDKMEKIRKFES